MMYTWINLYEKTNPNLRELISKMRVKYKIQNRISKKYKKKMSRYAWGQKTYIYL